MGDNPLSGLRIVVAGLIAQYPLGGVTWDYLQFVLGLARLGHDVYYLEDTGQWPYNPSDRGVGKGCDFNVRYLSGVLSRYGLERRWMYRSPCDLEWFGLSARERDDVLRTADLVINVSGTLQDPGRFTGPARLVYVDTDPVFTQVKLARGQADFRRLVDTHDVHFTFGELIGGGATHATPTTDHRWRPLRQPVLIDEWASGPDEPRDAFTTVMNWTSYKPVEHAGQRYGQKDTEFMRFIDLPQLVDVPLEVAIGAGKLNGPPLGLLRRRGWTVVEPERVCPDLDSYRAYVTSSKGEWSVAKHGYVLGDSGWFSCRSACYLAAGRPVVVQDTGFSRVLPTGTGLLAFDDPDQAADAVRHVVSDYRRHARAAREIAHAYFDHRAVLTRLVDVSMTSGRARSAIAT